MIKQLHEQLRNADNDQDRQQTLGVIHYLQQLKVGSIVDTSYGRGVVVELYDTDVWFVYIVDKGVIDYATDQLKVVG